MTRMIQVLKLRYVMLYFVDICSTVIISQTDKIGNDSRKPVRYTARMVGRMWPSSGARSATMPWLSSERICWKTERAVTGLHSLYFTGPCREARRSVYSY
jgi:hypothetical protein